MDELTAEDRLLVEQAKQATANSYARYSHFYVGAALRLQDGRIVMGANQENAAFPSGLCAERTAIFSAQAQWPDQPVVALAIAARNEQGFVATPGASMRCLPTSNARSGRPIQAAHPYLALRYRGGVSHRFGKRFASFHLCRRKHALTVTYRTSGLRLRKRKKRREAKKNRHTLMALAPATTQKAAR